MTGTSSRTPRDHREQHRERQEHRIDELAQDDEPDERGHAHDRAEDELAPDPAAEGVIDDAHDRERVAPPGRGQRVLERSGEPGQVLEHPEGPERDDEVAERTDERRGEAAARWAAATRCRTRPLPPLPDTLATTRSTACAAIREAESLVPRAQGVEPAGDLSRERLDLVAHGCPMSPMAIPMTTSTMTRYSSRMASQRGEHPRHQPTEQPIHGRRQEVDEQQPDDEWRERVEDQQRDDQQQRCRARRPAAPAATGRRVARWTAHARPWRPASRSIARDTTRGAGRFDVRALEPLSS